MSGVALTIRHVGVRAVEVPIARPAETASGTMTTTPLVLLDVVMEEGGPNSLGLGSVVERLQPGPPSEG